MSIWSEKKPQSTLDNFTSRPEHHVNSKEHSIMTQTCNTHFTHILQKSSADVYIASKQGLHLRSSGRLVQLANAYNAKITLTCGNKKADAASVLDILSLTAGQGSCLTIQAEGQDADRALREIVCFLGSNEL
jgi:phosphotransferase system HPr (HPr) family protein